MVFHQSCVLLDNIAYFSLRQTVSQNPGFLLDLFHESAVFVDDFPDFALKVCPYFFFVLNDELRLVKLDFQLIYFLG